MPKPKSRAVHHWCVRCFDDPTAAMKECPECALHLKGPNREIVKLSRTIMNLKFERTWFGKTQITTPEQHHEVRLAWLAVLYEAGWTEAEFEDDSVYIPNRKKPKLYRAVGRTAKKKAA